MKNIIFIVLFLFLVSCERDLNKDVDFYSPIGEIPVDSFEVKKGDVVELKALLKDKSGISYIALEYSSWGVKDEILFDNPSMMTEYEYSSKITVPEDALSEWEEVYTKHDGTSFNIVQQYHKLSLTCYDYYKNKNTFYFFCKGSVI